MNNPSEKWQNRLILAVVIAVMGSMLLLIIETFQLILPGLWTALTSGDEKALGAYLVAQGRLRSFLTLWFLSFVQVVSIVIPSMPVQLAAGIAYGPWKGFVNSFTASALANMTVFLLARRLGRVIRRLSAGNARLTRMLNSLRSSDAPLFYTVLAFLTPGLPNGIVPYAAAQSGLPPAKFLAAILLSLPLPTLLTCAAGNFIVSGDWTVSLLIVGGLYLFVGILFRCRRRIITRVQRWSAAHSRR